MNEKYKDTDLREALRRKYADTPKLPENFMRKPAPSLPPRGEGRIKSLPSRGRLEGASYRWRLVAAAACLLIIVGVGFTLLPKDEPAKPAQMIVQQTKPAVIPMGETATKQAPTKELPQPLPREGSKKPTLDASQREGSTESLPSGRLEGASTGGLEGASNLHYAAHDPMEENEPCQDPARVDDFIEKMAAYHNVKEGELKCTSANDSNVVSRVYVFPDKKEVDVFGRLLQVACWYGDETPGYHLNFSHQQFFFELKDQRRQLQYRWIAERINGKILLYGTNAPIGAQTTSACYQEYRNELMHTNSIHLKTRKI